MKADATRKLKEAEEATKVGLLTARDNRVAAVKWGFCYMMGKGCVFFFCCLFCCLS